ncbi:hypothetical protein Daus18300_000946 [Diaporthe australafricana]|uniref:Translation initiation factor 3 C-terminal domain-containing protein n=1 Tax=Diaporthe australafricana TaxID=127596 RepID=A0ABR3Y253_9PEZI
MPGPRCVFNTATALRRVFMPASVGHSNSLHLTRIFVPALLALPPQARAYWAGRDSGTSQAPPKPSSSLFDRDSHARHPSGGGFKVRRGGRPHKDGAAPGRVAVKLGRLPRDEEIAWPYVFVKTMEGHERLESPRLLKDVLAELDRKTSYLETVALPSADHKDAPRWPVCKIVNKKEELARQKDLKERKKKSTTKEKELELNWAMGSHDLDHRLKTMQKFLSKGYKVKVLLLKKARSKARATEEDARALVERVVQAVGEVKGAMEWKKREGQVLGTYTIFLQGKAQDETTTTTSPEVAQETPTTSSDVAEESDGSSTGAQSQA